MSKGKIVKYMEDENVEKTLCGPHYFAERYVGGDARIILKPTFFEQHWKQQTIDMRRIIHLLGGHISIDWIAVQDDE